MSRLVCSFCAHSNPEGSKFCNACGSQLNLRPCSRCAAINPDSAAWCSQCGASLPEASTLEMEAPAFALVDTSYGAASLQAMGDSVPIALAHRLEKQPRTPAAPARPPEARIDEPAAAPALAVDPLPREDAALIVPRDARTDYGTPNPGRARVWLLCAVLISIAGGIYWMWPYPARPPAHPDSRPEASVPVPTPGPALAPEPGTSAPAAPPSADAASPAPTATPARSAVSSPAPSSEPATAPAPPSPGPQVQAPDPAATPPSASVPTPPEAQASPEAPKPSGREATNLPSAARGGDPRQRSAASARTAEQAQRDAIATQRLISRELGDSSRPEPDSKTSP